MYETEKWIVYENSDFDEDKERIFHCFTFL